MLKKFLLYIILLYIAVFVLSYSFRSHFSLSKNHSYKDLSISFKNLYVEYLWNKVKSIKSPADKLAIIKKVIALNPDYQPAYLEICNSINTYMVSGINVFELISIIKSSASFSNSDDLIDCYINALKLNSNLEEAISFLEKLYNEIEEPYRKGLYFERIKELRDDSNILIITKALDLYNKKFLDTPKDLSMLTETGIIDHIPEDPYGGQYFISKDGRLRSTSARSKEGLK